MKRGFKIAVLAIDGETGDRLTENLYGFESCGTTWKLTTKGMLVSTTMPKDERFLRVVELIEGQPARYSEPIAVKPNGKSRVLIKDVKILRGTRVVGKLEKNVSRPVKNGYVIAVIGLKPLRDPNHRDLYWTWYDRVDIQEDGTFVFESLPSDEVLQMVAVCDGWVPQRPNASDIAPFFSDKLKWLARWAVIPSLIKVEGEEVEATLKMARAKKVLVTVVGPDDQPIVGAKVWCSLDQKWFNVRPQIYGQTSSTRRQLIESWGGDFEIEGTSRYCVVTDKNGFAELANLPNHPASERLRVSHDDFELPINGRQRVFKYDLNDGDATEVTMKLQKKGTEVIDWFQMLEK